MSDRKRLLSYIFFVLGIVIVAGALWYSLHIGRFKKVVPDVPQEITGLAMTQFISGPEAVGNIQQLHGVEIPLAGGVVAANGNQNIILWVSDAGDVTTAMELTELMRDRIAEGGSPFVELGDFELEGKTIFALDGLGQVHYYWQAGNLVIWLAVDVDLAEHAMREMIVFYP